MRDAKLREQTGYEHVEPASDWTVEDSAKADAEGWNLFNYPESTDLEKDDEAGKFESDDDALLFVVENRTPLHLKALRLWQATNPTGYAEAINAMGLNPLTAEGSNNG